jgi:hypothetical protein
MRGLLDDLAYAARSLAAHRGYAAALVLVLALGIGANTAIFTLVDAALFRPLPVHRPGELVRLFATDSTRREFRSSSYPVYTDASSAGTSSRCSASGRSAGGCSSPMTTAPVHHPPSC